MVETAQNGESWARRARLWGMIHVPPSPGCRGFRGVESSRRAVLDDARSLLEAGFDGLLLENMHDFPTVREREMGPEIAAYLAVLARDVRDVAGDGVPLGAQVLFAAHRTALAVALVGELQVVRAEAWTYGHLSDKGWVEASAGTTVRYAEAIGAGAVEIWADVKKKHASHAVSADLSIADVAAGLRLHRADAVVVTGGSTGQAPAVEDLRSVREATDLPVVLGSGLTVQNAPLLAAEADAFIVGSSIKEGGDWRRPVDPDRAAELSRALRPPR